MVFVSVWVCEPCISLKYVVFLCVVLCGFLGCIFYFQENLKIVSNLKK